jgi:polyhydroxyalkanoate synthesis regulator phasin
MDSNSVLRQLLLMGVGTTTLVAEQLSKAADDLVKNGKMDPEQASTMINTIVDQVKAEQGNFETTMQRQVRNIMQDLGVPRQQEMDELRGRLDRLERQMRKMENEVYKNR